jgi:hypothetical protein
MHAKYNIDKSDISLETTRIQVQSNSDQTELVVFNFLADQIAEEVNESLTLQLVPTPATLQIMPTGEGVFFEQEIALTIMDVDGEFVSPQDPK